MLSPSRSDLEKQIRKYVSLATTIPERFVIPGNDNAPAPRGLYASVLLISSQTLGADNTTISNNKDSKFECDITVRGARVNTYSVQTYRSGADDAIRRLLAFHYLPDARIFLEKALFSFKSCRIYNNVDAISSTKWEERAAAELIVYTNDYLTVQTNAVKSIEINNLIDDESVTYDRILNIKKED